MYKQVQKTCADIKSKNIHIYFQFNIKMCRVRVPSLLDGFDLKEHTDEKLNFDG